MGQQVDRSCEGLYYSYFTGIIHFVVSDQFDDLIDKDNC